MSMSACQSRQSLPDPNYISMVGTALCVFNQNNAFVIENRLYKQSEPNWHRLMCRTSGQISKNLQSILDCDVELATLFSELVEMRNRIIHSFQITKDGRQILRTMDPETMVQFDITEDYLESFIKKNGDLCSMLHRYRDSLSISH